MLIFDTNGIHNVPKRDDINIYPINAMEATLEIGNPKAYNMVVMGALLEAMPYKLPMENVIKGLKKSLRNVTTGLFLSTSRPSKKVARSSRSDTTVNTQRSGSPCIGRLFLYF